MGCGTERKRSLSGVWSVYLPREVVDRDEGSELGRRVKVEEETVSVKGGKEGVETRGITQPGRSSSPLQMREIGVEGPEPPGDTHRYRCSRGFKDKFSYLLL